ncbi:phosphotransferase [Pseudomonas sp. P5_109]|uniref:phosphotransferase n=1 Tax=Pseudomonas sp. P5_109 TaxID=3043441 RepID=UPI002A36BD2B|nr:phosphotransferase [Pseudomonas sp. P5_109]WPN29901.1 phosphotransferase [Pseudomonas sp. P5_109]
MMAEETIDYVCPIKFEYRFDRNAAKHSQALTIRRALANAYAEKHQSKNKGAFEIESFELYPVPRAGNSGSEVFYLDIYHQGQQQPNRFVAKFQDVKSTKKEYVSSLRAKRAQMCSEVEYEVDEVNDVGIIICELARVAHHCEFRVFFLDLKNSDEQCASALSSILSNVGNQPNDQGERKNFVSDYEWYVDRKNQPLLRLDAIVRSGDDCQGLSLLAQGVKSHYDRMVADFDHQVLPYLVHGDLHARNLMVNSKNANQTELIDFGWVHDGHPAKDFVLMEATIKYQLLRELLRDIRPDRAENQHLSVEYFESFERFMCRRGMWLPEFEEYKQSENIEQYLREDQVQAVRRVYVCVAQIRQQARTALQRYISLAGTDKYSIEQHYFASLFLVVLGLSAMPEMDMIWTLIALNKIGDRIWNSPN